MEPNETDVAGWRQMQANADRWSWIKTDESQWRQMKATEDKSMMRMKTEKSVMKTDEGNWRQMKANEDGWK